MDAHTHVRTPIARRLVAGVSACLIVAIAAPAWAQVDPVGYWWNRVQEDGAERGPGPAIGEYQGLPINDANRLRADSWMASMWSVPEHQCIPHPVDYGPNFSNFEIAKILDPATFDVVAYKYTTAWMNEVRMIWMDGRPHPPEYAEHTWQGFSTGVWEGDVLNVTTTHLKPGYIRRNGLARSGKATVREHFIRNGNILTLVTIVNDPVYLTEPYIKSRDFILGLGFRLSSFPCTVGVEVVHDKGWVPHNLPGTNAALADFAAEYHLPFEASRGGAETMFPEYMLKMKSLPPAQKPSAAAAR